MKTYFQELAGYTLLEVLFSIALIALLFSFSFTLYSTISQDRALESAVYDSRSTLHQALLFAQTERENSSWGVKFVEGKIFLFAGTTYAERNPSLDEVTELAVPFSGADEYVFSKKTAHLVSPQSTTFTSPSGKVKVLSISEYGIISIQ